MRNKKSDGFTLVEVIVALAAFMLVMLAITGILISVINYTATNRNSYKTDNMSKVFFETIREDRPTLSQMPSGSELISNEVSYKGEFSTEDELRSFIKNKLLKPGSRPTTVSNPTSFADCKSSSKQFSIGIKMKYVDEALNVPDVDDEDGDGNVTEIIVKHAKYYEIETWCWDTYEGESSIINRKTYVTPR